MRTAEKFHDARTGKHSAPAMWHARELVPRLGKGPGFPRITKFCLVGERDREGNFGDEGSAA